MRYPTGVVRKSQPTSGQVHVNRPLTNISVMHQQGAEKFVATRMFPQVPVMKQGDLYFVYNRGDFYRSIAQRRAPGSESAGGGYRLATQPYFCDVWAVHDDVDDQTRANSDAPLDADRDATIYTTGQCMLAREIEWVQNFFVPGVWTSQSTPGTLWSAGGSTPIEDIRAAIQAREAATGYRPNKVCMSPNVWNVLQDHPDFVSRVNAGQTPGGPATVNLQAFAAVLEIEEAMVARGVVNTANEGAADAVDFIAGDHMLLAYVPPTPGLRIPSAGYTITWRGLLGASDLGGRITRFRMDPIQSWRVECEMAFDMHQVANDLAHFFNQPV